MNASGLSLPEEKEKESMARVYLVVEYDKTQIILDSPKGTLVKPTLMCLESASC
jgi:hypothetical protein